MPRGGIRITEDTLTPGIDGIPKKLDRGLVAVTEFHATRAEAYMRANAPWTDRTTNARNGLNAVAVHAPLRHVIVCHHTMPYGIWLEVANGGKYRIIIPTIKDQGRATMATIRGLLGRLGR